MYFCAHDKAVHMQTVPSTVKAPRLGLPLVSINCLCEPIEIPLVCMADICQYPESSQASITALFYRHQVFIMGKEELCWFSPNFEIVKPWGWMNQKLRIFFVVAVLFFPFFNSLFFLQTGYIFKTCHPQTVWNTKVSALFLSTDIIWNHLKGQIICPLISQTARVDIFASF